MRKVRRVTDGCTGCCTDTTKVLCGAHQGEIDGFTSFPLSIEHNGRQGKPVFECGTKEVVFTILLEVHYEHMPFECFCGL